MKFPQTFKNYQNKYAKIRINGLHGDLQLKLMLILLMGNLRLKFTWGIYGETMLIIDVYLGEETPQVYKD